MREKFNFSFIVGLTTIYINPSILAMCLTLSLHNSDNNITLVSDMRES